MNHSDKAMRQYDEMCIIVGSVVFALVTAGHETRRATIAEVLRNEITTPGKWEPDQVQFLLLAIEQLESVSGS